MTNEDLVSLFHIDADSVIPLYHQIKQNLRGLVEDGVLQSGQFLPGERDLAEFYGVNRLTVRQAVGDLVREGLLVRQRGVGTSVAGPKLTQDMERVLGFSDRVRETGRRPSTRTIELTVAEAKRKVATRLGIEAGDEVWKLVRLRLADDEPVMLEIAHLPRHRFVGLDRVDFSERALYRVLADEYDCIPTVTEEVLEPVIVSDYEAQLLECEPRQASLLVEATVRDQQGEVFEFSTSIVRGDRARYYFVTNAWVGADADRRIHSTPGRKGISAGGNHPEGEVRHAEYRRLPVGER